MRPIIIFLTVALLFVALAWTVADVACAATTEQVMYRILESRDSPLADEVWTPVAFRRTQGAGFPLLGYYAVGWAETNLARDGFYAQTFNLGCIRGGKEGSPWRDWRIGTYKGFNVYENSRMGQRALLRLLWERGYAPLLAAHDWRGFTKKYWGSDYYSNPGHREEYIADLAAAYRLLVSDGKKFGLNPVHLQ